MPKISKYLFFYGNTAVFLGVLYGALVQGFTVPAEPARDLTTVGLLMLAYTGFNAFLAWTVLRDAE